MNIKEHRDTVGGYVREFGRWTVGTTADRDDARAELEAHLREAEDAGRLEETLERLGRPKDAARTFAEGRGFVAAALGRRLVAALIDYSTLTALVVSYRVFVLGHFLPGRLVSGPYTERIGIIYDLPLLGAGTRMALAWEALFWQIWPVVASSAATAALVLIVFEWRSGSTPGKHLVGLRVASEDGTTPTLFQAAVRRLPLLFWGALTLFDVALAFRGPRHQRAFEIVAQTTVVDVRRTTGEATVWNRPLGGLIASQEASAPEEVSS